MGHGITKLYSGNKKVIVFLMNNYLCGSLGAHYGCRAIFRGLYAAGGHLTAHLGSVATTVPIVLLSISNLCPLPFCLFACPQLLPFATTKASSSEHDATARREETTMSEPHPLAQLKEEPEDLAEPVVPVVVVQLNECWTTSMTLEANLETWSSPRRLCVDCNPR